MGRKSREKLFRRQQERRVADRIESLAKDFLDPIQVPVLLQAIGVFREASIPRVQAAQRMRDLNLLPAEAGFFLVACAIEDIADPRSEHVYKQEYEQRWNDVCERHGLDPELQHNDAPMEVLAVQKLLNDIDDRIHVSALREFGEEAMADLYDENYEEFHRRREVGRVLFFGKGTL